MNLDPNYHGVVWDDEETNPDKIGELFSYTRHSHASKRLSFDFYPEDDYDTLPYGTVVIYLGLNMFMMIESNQKFITETDLSGPRWNIYFDPIEEDDFPV